MKSLIYGAKYILVKTLLKQQIFNNGSGATSKGRVGGKELPPNLGILKLPFPSTFFKFFDNSSKFPPPHNRKNYYAAPAMN